jgi:hypothetical protein
LKATATAFPAEEPLAKEPKDVAGQGARADLSESLIDREASLEQMHLRVLARQCVAARQRVDEAEARWVCHG